MSEIFRVCSCCKISKVLNETNYYFRKQGVIERKCKECKNINSIDKFKTEFIEMIKDDNDWKNHPDFKMFYFERNTDKIFNLTTAKYLQLRSFMNLTSEKEINIKWEIFNGPIPENKIVKIKNKGNIHLDNLECVYMYCVTCENIIENPITISKYCSNNCQMNNRNKNSRDGINNNLNTYLSSKISHQKITNKKYNISVDYDADYLKSLGKKCIYCEVNCKFGTEKESLQTNKIFNFNNTAIDDTDTLTFDRKNSELGYCKENIVVCCWLCNRMKNITDYTDWIKFIDFIKDKSNIYTELKRSSPSYYPNLKDPRNTFLELAKKQNYVDSIFNFFPIIFLDRNCLFNMSIDAMDTTLPKEEKHRPDNLQIIPKCLNYGKNILSTEDFLKEWIKRGFKTDFTNCSIKLPENYSNECYFEKIIKQ